MGNSQNCLSLLLASSSCHSRSDKGHRSVQSRSRLYPLKGSPFGERDSPTAKWAAIKLRQREVRRRICQPRMDLSGH